uniref:Similar to ATP-dependent helicase n=1 Tax=Arundo donax TaxID=35708 RepID=A0A0A9HSL8_ARUDO
MGSHKCLRIRSLIWTRIFITQLRGRII